MIDIQTILTPAFNIFMQFMNLEFLAFGMSIKVYQVLLFTAIFGIISSFFMSFYD